MLTLLLVLSLRKEEEKRVELERLTLRPAMMAIIFLSLSKTLSYYSLCTRGGVVFCTKNVSLRGSFF